MSQDPEEIWIGPSCENKGSEWGRTWAISDVFDECECLDETHKPVKYVRADIAEEVYVDESGEAWTRPTAWAYAQACKALRKSKERDAELSRDAKCRNGAK